MPKLLTTAASAVILLAATGAYANDYNRDNRDDSRIHNAGQYSAIQKGESASTKAYGYNKQGDHYTTNNAQRDRWNTAYPGAYPAYGAKHGIMIKKGGSGISDATAEATTRQYGSYWN